MKHPCGCGFNILTVAGSRIEDFVNGNLGNFSPTFRYRYGFPALVAVNPAKLKYAALRSAFEYGSVRSFVDRVRSVCLLGCYSGSLWDLNRFL